MTTRTPETDIVVVGAGAAGCVIARRLADRSPASVLLLEAGDAEVDASLTDGWRLQQPPDWGFRAESVDGGEGPRLRRGRLVGGTSWLTRFAVRGSPADFDRWAGLGNPGWSFADVLPAFRRIEDDAEFGDRPWHGTGGPIPITRYPELRRSPIHRATLTAFADAGLPAVEDHNAPGAVGAGPMPMSSRRGRRATSSTMYLADPPPNLALGYGALVDTVLMDGGQATGVRLADGSTIRARTVILSAGAYGSPCILLRSGIGPAVDLAEHAIPVRIDLSGVGANLADHPGVELDSGWRGRGTAGPLLHSIATFHSSQTSPESAPDLMYWVTDPDAADPGFFLDPVLLRPSARGRVRLRSADPAAPPRIQLPRLDRVDVDRLAEAYEQGVAIARHPALRARVRGSLPQVPAPRHALRALVAERTYSIPHVVGTCAMGPQAADGAVVDASGAVHGIAGLYVVDASIIPEPPSGFPHLVTIMLAEHLAERWSG